MDKTPTPEQLAATRKMIEVRLGPAQMSAGFQSTEKPKLPFNPGLKIKTAGIEKPKMETDDGY